MGEDDQLRIYEKGRKHEHTEGQSPVIKNAALCFQEWNTGVTPKFLNISLRLIIIGDGLAHSSQKNVEKRASDRDAPYV